MFLGALLLMGAVSLLLWNTIEDRSASNASKEVLRQLAEMAGSEESEIVQTTEMPEIIMDGHAYIGYLIIPELGIQLPVMSECTNANLQISPCRYHGSTFYGNLVIAAHNYPGHFGRLSELSIGDAITFTDASGKVTKYDVVEVSTLRPSDVDIATNGEFELSMFTCTYSGRDRILVRCIERK